MKTVRIKLNTINDVNKFVNITNEYYYDIDAICGRYIVDAKSILGILSFGIPKTIDVTIHTGNKQLADTFIEDLSLWEVVE